MIYLYCIRKIFIPIDFYKIEISYSNYKLFIITKLKSNVKLIKMYVELLFN